MSQLVVSAAHQNRAAVPTQEPVLMRNEMTLNHLTILS